MHSEDRFTVPGRTRAAVERDLLSHGGEPDADWTCYRLPAVTADGESVPLRAEVHLTETREGVVVDAVYRHGRILAWRRAWFRFTVIDARRLLRAALHAPAEATDPAARTAAADDTVLAVSRLRRRLLGLRVAIGVAGIALSIAALAVDAHARQQPAPPPRTPTYTYPSTTVAALLQLQYGLPATVCNGNHLLHLDHVDQTFACVADTATTYDVRVADLDPLTFGVVVHRP